MYLSELFDHLSYGELAQLSVGGEAQGVINSANQVPIITHLNLGLLELYKRFPIALKTVTVQQLNYLSDYYLDSRYAVTNPKSTNDVDFPKYIIDNEYDPFLDDILLIEGIADEAGDWQPLNDENKETTILTTGYNSINVPNPATESALFVYYRATPEKIDIDTLDAESVVIPLPDQYMEALINFIGYRCFSSFNMNSPETVNYYQKFEMACNLLNREGIRYKDMTSNVRLGSNGWL